MKCEQGAPIHCVGRSGARAARGLDVLNFVLADVQAGLGPFVAIYLAAYGWNEERVGMALTAGGIAGLVAQTPAGALVDALRAKRALIAICVGFVAIGATLIALFPSFGPVTAAQVLIGVASSAFIPAICAITLGLVGHRAFDARQGRNQAFNSAGNVVAALAMGLLGYLISNRSVLMFVVALAIPTVLALLVIPANEIDHDLARGGARDRTDTASRRVDGLFRNRTLVVFLACAVMFHFANAAMLPLLGELLAKGHGRTSMLFMSACVVTTQVVIAVIATWSGRRARSWGRKPVLLIGFGVLPIRGVLYTLTSKTTLLVAIQVLDGIGAGIFGVVSVLVIADLTRGTGRFNLTLGAITTAVGIGAALSQVIAGGIVHHAGANAGFLFLAVIAAAAFALLLVFMPETRDLEPARP
ncbi:MAG: MFS transporter [Deltaproteobacteria bacterium]|nr:MFS transporter [Deltaproteobacteria bacterium]